MIVVVEQTSVAFGYKLACRRMEHDVIEVVEREIVKP